MKINSLFALALVAQFASPLAFADPEMRRRGNQGGRNGQLIVDSDALERRSQEDRLDCKEFEREGRRNVRRDQTRELQAQFCEYMSNKMAMEDAWIDIDASEDDLRAATRALNAEKANQQSAITDKTAAKRILESLAKSIPRLVSEKQTQVANKANAEKRISAVNFQITTKQNEIKPIQRSHKQKLSEQNNYFNNTFKATKTTFEGAVAQKQGKSTQLISAQNTLRLKNREMSAIDRAIPRLNSAVTRANSAVTSQTIMTRRDIERDSLENQRGYALLETHTQILVREMRKMATPSNATVTRNRGQVIASHNNVSTTVNFFKYKDRARTRVEIYERYQTPAYKSSRRILRDSLDIDSKPVQRLEAKIVALILAEKAVAQKKQDKVATQQSINSASSLVSSLPGEISTLTARVTSLTPNFNNQKSNFEGLVAKTNSAKRSLDKANGELATLRSNLAIATRALSQANSGIASMDSLITAERAQKAKQQNKKATAQAKIDASAGLIAERQTAVANLEKKAQDLRSSSRRLIQKLRDGSVLETYDRNTGVAATHIFVGAFPNALNFNEGRYQDEDREFRGRNRYRGRDFRNARHGNNIRATYERAKRNGERIYLWGDLSDSYSISRLSDETGVFGTYYPRQNRRGYVDMVVETKSSDRALVLGHDEEQRLNFIDIDSELAVPVITAERMNRRGGVIDRGHVLMSASLKDSGAVVFTSGISISDLKTNKLQRILDKINRAPVSDFAIQREDTDVSTGSVNPMRVVNDASATATGDMTINDRQNPVVEKMLPITIGQGRIVKEIQVDVKIAYSYIGDLSIKLKSPQGHIIILRDRQGGSSKQIDSTYTLSTQDLTMITQDNLDTRSAASSRNISREYTSAQTTDGQWSIIIEDALPTHGDSGTLNHIELKVIAE